MSKPGDPVLSIYVLQVAQQFLLQMPARGLFDRAPLCGYALFFCLSFSPRSRFYRLRHVPDLRPPRTGFSLFWFRVWIHQN
jgi:hypothetical protein